MAPLRPANEAEIGFKRKRMVRWLSPFFLIRALHEVDESGRFARYTDKREVESGLPTALHQPGDIEPSSLVFRAYDDDSYRDRNGDLWIDFASDVGEGFHPTYTVAWLLSRPRLKLTDEDETHETERGRILVLGGDQVYPSASWGKYRDRFVGPYTAAFPWEDDEQKAPHLFAIPGNHDWYDGLTGFMRVFCAGGWIGGWRTRQRRSYFALKLSKRWWLWATDIQFDTYLDTPQLHYFRAAARSFKEGDRVILMTAKPSWIEAEKDKPELMATGSWKTLNYVESKLIAGRGAKVAVTLTGDKHHYARYVAADGQFPEQRITAGGGGAHTSATHGLPPTVPLPLGEEEETSYDLVRETMSPSCSESEDLRNGLFKKFLSLGAIWLGMTIGFVYLGIAWAADGGKLALFGAFALLAALLVGFAKGKQPAGLAKATLVLGVPHAVLHVGAAFLLWQAALELDWTWEWEWILFFICASAVGLAIFLLYMILANLTDGEQHATEIFGGLASTEYKNFLRLRLRKDGSLTIYPVGIRRSPKWAFRKEGAHSDPWFAAPGFDEKDPEARLLEPPIAVSPPTSPIGDDSTTASREL